MRSRAEQTPIVFQPGASGRAAFWAPVAKLLAGLGPTQLLAYPGFGGVPADPTITSSATSSTGSFASCLWGSATWWPSRWAEFLAARLAIEHPERVARLVLVATSGGVDVAGLGGEDWRRDDRASLPGVPSWFVDDRTDLTARLGAIRAPTLLVWSDADPVAPSAWPTCSPRASPFRIECSCEVGATSSPRSAPRRWPRRS